MLISHRPWDPSSTKDELEVKVVFLKRYGVCDDLYEYLLQINDSEIHLDHKHSDIDLYEIIICNNKKFQLRNRPP